MSFFERILVISGVMMVIIDEISGKQCCKPTTVQFRHKPGYTCKNFPDSSYHEPMGYFPPNDNYGGQYSTVCETKICKDGENRKHCSAGECKCETLMFFNCKDTADECYDEARSIDDAFANVWVQKYIAGIYDFKDSKGRIVKISN